MATRAALSESETASSSASESNPDPQASVVGVILAAGRGRRMHSRTPKPLHRAAGKELIRFPVELLDACGIERIVAVVSPDNAPAVSALLGNRVGYAVQPEPRGTADALACALYALDTLDALDTSDALDAAPPTIVVLAGDTPLVRAESVRQLLAEHQAVAGRRMTILSATDVFAPDLGRIERASVTSDGRVGAVSAIVEASDRPGPGLAPAEVNTGVYCLDGAWTRANLDGIAPSASGERYLTGLAARAASSGADVAAMPIALADEAMGVNNREQLAGVETVLRDRICRYWMEHGVTIVDLAATYIDADVVIGRDTTLLPGTMLSGNTAVGADCRIGPNAVIEDSAIGDRCRVIASFLEGAQVAADVEIGPYCHLRPGAVIESAAHLGNFVEVKNSRIGAATAAGHFCYLGDADIGAGVNIGAGTVTCNYDGVDKHPTRIGDGAFIGSDTMLIAPVSVGESAATGAGAVVTKDIPDAGRAVGVPARLVRGRITDKR